MEYKTKKEILLEKMCNYKSYIEKLKEENPLLAKKEAREALIRIGIINEKGDLKPPYNGEKVNENDFELGPRKKVKRKLNN